MMHRVFFDQSRRPVKTTGFDYDALDGDDAYSTRLEQRYAVSEWFRARYEFIMRARTIQSRQIRWVLVQVEINGTSASAIAKQFRVTRQSVHERPGSSEKVKLFRVPTGTAIALVANGIATFTDRRTQKQLRQLIESISGKSVSR